MLTLYVNADNIIRLSGLTAAGEPANAAEVEYSLLDEAGVEVADGTLEYVPATDGDYQGTLPATEDDEYILQAGATYFLEVTAESGESHGFWRTECTAQFNDGSE